MHLGVNGLDDALFGTSRLVVQEESMFEEEFHELKLHAASTKRPTNFDYVIDRMGSESQFYCAFSVSR